MKAKSFTTELVQLDGVMHLRLPAAEVSKAGSSSGGFASVIVRSGGVRLREKLGAARLRRGQVG